MEDRYYDLDIPLKTVDAQLIARVFDAGYQYIGISQTVAIDDFCFDTQTKNADLKRKKNKEERQEMRKSLFNQLEPPASNVLNKLIEDSGKFRATIWPSINFGQPRLFRRLNLYCSNPSTAGLFFRDFGGTLNNFDIVSFCPTTSQALTFACDLSSNIDLISLDLENSNDVRVTNKQFSMAISRGIYFEFHTSPLLRPASGGVAARSILSQYFSTTFSSTTPKANKAIVISSGALCGWEVRRPLAISALLTCLGFGKRETAKHCLTKAPHAVITHGLCRSRTTHGAATVLKLLALPNVLSININSKKRRKSDKSSSADAQEPTSKQTKLTD